MTRLTATERVQRILAVIPWIVSHQGATVAEICDRFALGRDELLEDLDFVFYNVGLHPFTPDVLAEVTVEDDRVRIHIGDYFRRPVRLTHAEALTLLAAGRALSGRPGSDPDGTLGRAVGKLAGVLGVDASDALEVALGEADPTLLRAVSDAAAARQQLELSYYSYGRDEASRRTVDPLRVFARDGHWYLLALCHSAGGERLFRVDRIEGAEPTGASFDAPSAPDELEVDRIRPDRFRSGRTVEITAPASAAWVGETYPCDEVDTLDDGRIRIVLPVTATPWLERLLLRLGPTATARDAETGEDLTGLAAAAAVRVLGRYDREDSDHSDGEGAAGTDRVRR